MAELNTIKRVLAHMVATYPQKPGAEESAMLTSVWTQVLADVPDALLDAAAADYLRSDAAFRPAPGQLRSLAMRISDGDANARAARAWIESKEQVYFYDTITDPIAAAVWRLLNVEEWRNRNIEKDPERFWQDRFCKMYMDFAEREQGRALIGAGNGDGKAQQLIAQTAKRLAVGAK